MKSLRPTWRPYGGFAVILLSFFAATAAVHGQMSASARTALEAAEGITSGVERLATVQGEARRLEALLDAGRGRAAPNPDAVGDSYQALRRAVDGYFALPAVSAEGEAWARVDRASRALDVGLARFAAEADGGANEAAAPARDAAAELAAAASHAVEANVGRAGELAARVRQERDDLARLAFVLDAACALVAFAGAIALGRSARTRAVASERRYRLQQARAAELERFAGTVAHDIMSPLGVAGYALEIAQGPDDVVERPWAIECGTAALGRVQRLVTGLLDFARAGGKPEAGARADVVGTVADVVSELNPLARQTGTQLVVDLRGPGFVACNPGVLTSLVANLAHNAIKYVGDGPVRRVELRVREQGGMVRVEVEDTGPGLPPGLEARVFEPYVRDRASRQPGLGLGLATVQRLAEAHGGRVGVQSAVGRGSTFWFELPRAEGAAAPAPQSAEVSVLQSVDAPAPPGAEMPIARVA
jgi:signal transduction histidine kinase